VGAGTLAVQDTGLVSATEYFYQVQACNAAGCAGYSSEVSDTTSVAALVADEQPVDELPIYEALVRPARLP
jgi:hypothetical protein